MSNQCPYCGSYRNVCVSPAAFKYVCLACEKFFRKDEQPKQTVFEEITQSPEVLAPYCISTKPSINGDTLYYYSTVTSDIYLTENEAIAATVAKLKGIE